MLYAMALSFCLHIPDMLIRSSVHSFVCCQRVLVGQWSAWPNSTIMLVAPQCCWAIWSRCFLSRDKLHFLKFILVASVGAYSWLPSTRHTCISDKISCTVVEVSFLSAVNQWWGTWEISLPSRVESAMSWPMRYLNQLSNTYVVSCWLLSLLS